MFLPKRLHGFKDLRFLKVSNLHCHSLYASSEKCQNIHDMSMTIALQDLSGDRSWMKTKELTHPFFYFSRAMSVCSHRSRYFPIINLFSRLKNSLSISNKLVIPVEKFEPEGHGFCVNTMSASNTGGILIFFRFFPYKTSKLIDLFQNYVERFS